MLHIVLLILKIIGIILSAILGVVFLAVCCALFVPVRYRIEVSREEGEGNPPFIARAKITWLFHLVNIHLCYPADVYVRVRLFLFTLFRIPEKEKRRKKTDGKKRSRRKKAGDETPPQTTQAAEETAREPESSTAGEETLSSGAGSLEETATVQEQTKTGTVALEEAVAGPENVTVTDTFDTEPSPEAAESGQEASGFFGRIRQKIRCLLDKIKAFWEKLKTAFQNIRYTIRHMCDKIKTASDTIQYYREVFLSDAFGRSFALCKEQAGVVLKDLKPDRVEVDLIVGTGDPASTGEVLAVCGMLYPVFGPKVRIEGDFERARLEGCVFIKGKIRAFTFLRVAWKLYRNKDIRTLIKLFKKEAV